MGSLDTTNLGSGSREPKSPDKKPAVGIVAATHNLVECKVFEDGSIARQPSSRSLIRMWWHEKVRRVMIIKKPTVKKVAQMARNMAVWLNEKFSLKIMVEPNVKTEDLFKDLTFVETWRSPEDVKRLHKRIDFVICIGGDGTLLWLNSLLPGPVPPVISFSMGSLGFLTMHSIDNYQDYLSIVVRGGFFLSLRARLVCKIFRLSSGEPTVADLQAIAEANHAEDEEPQTASDNPKGTFEKSFLALNEVVVDRGNSPYLTELDCFLNHSYLTRARADGLIIATATGSTAYSLSAGGSLLHPEVPAMLFTPVCPHSLSFRPMIFPDGSRLRIQVAKLARGTAWVSCDGKNRVELQRGDYIEIETSLHPLPSICLDGETPDWFKAVRNGLQWNARG